MNKIREWCEEYRPGIIVTGALVVVFGIVFIGLMSLEVKPEDFSSEDTTPLVYLTAIEDCNLYRLNDPSRVHYITICKDSNAAISR